MGGLGHSKVFSAWGIPSPSYIKIAYNSGLNVTHGGTITSFDAYNKATEWFLHHMNGLVLFKR
jgi:hypothetical protein